MTRTVASVGIIFEILQLDLVIRVNVTADGDDAGFSSTLQLGLFHFRVNIHAVMNEILKMYC